MGCGSRSRTMLLCLELEVSRAVLVGLDCAVDGGGRYALHVLQVDFMHILNDRLIDGSACV